MALVKNEIPLLEFDSEQRAVINPDREAGGLSLPRKCVFPFLGELIDQYAAQTAARKVYDFVSATKAFSIYVTEHKGEEITLCQAPVGSAP